MDILKSSQLVIFSHSTIFITFSYRSLAGFSLQTLTKFEAAKTGSGVGFLRLTAVCLAALLLGYTLRVLVTSYQLPWQRTRYTKVSSKFQFL